MGIPKSENVSYRRSLRNNTLRLAYAKMVSFVLLLGSILGYIIDTPHAYIAGEYYCTFIYVVISTYVYFKAKAKSNYFDFDTLFIITMFLIGYLASFAYDNPVFPYLYGIPFHQEYINKGTWLFTVGLNAYYCGSLFVLPKYKFRSIAVYPHFPTHPLFVMMIIFMTAYTALGGFAAYRNMYQGTTGTSVTSMIDLTQSLIIALSIILSSMDFLNKRRYRNYRLHLSYFIAICVFAILISLVGNRTAGMQILLPYLGLYALFFKPIRVKWLLIIIIPILSLSYLINVMRTGGDMPQKIESPFMMAIDFTIPYRATFEAMSYVDEFGYTYGKSMSGGILRAFPGIAGAVVGDSADEYVSASLLTHYSLMNAGIKQSGWGLGTNIIADIYLCFGLLGVIVLMYLLGWFVNRLIYAMKRNSLPATLTMGGLLGNCVFMARASYTHAFIFVLWSIIIAYCYLAIANVNRIK